MPKRTPYHVHVNATSVIKCSYDYDALVIGKLLSERYATFIDVSCQDKKNGGLIGQFEDGEPTKEFAHLKGVI